MQKMMQAEQQQQAARLQMRAMIADIQNTNADTFKKLEEAESIRLGDQLNKMTAYLDELDRQFNRDSTPPIQAPQGQQLQ
jgi:hypothetical protein